MKISIIIVNYNTKKFLADCLKSIYQDTKEVEVVVVDNASLDGSGEMVKSRFPQVKLIRNHKNLGFGKANNLGAKNCSGEIIFFLNSDTIVPRGALGKLGKYFEKNLHLGIVGPKVVLPSGSTQPYSFGDDISLINLIKDKISKSQPRAKTGKVDWVTGAALAISRDAFIATGGFDERFFMYFEDNDLCMRVRKIGLKVYLYTGAKIVHLGGKSLQSHQKRSEVYFKSQDYFFYKHYGWPGRILVQLLRLPYRFLVKKHES